MSLNGVNKAEAWAYEKSTSLDVYGWHKWWGQTCLWRGWTCWADVDKRLTDLRVDDAPRFPEQIFLALVESNDLDFDRLLNENNFRVNT